MHARRTTLLAAIVAGTVAGNAAAKSLEPAEAAHQMFQAAIRGDISKGKRLLRSNPEVLHTTIGNGWGSTPLHFASYNGQPRFAEWLLEEGADVNAVNRFGVMPLHDACSQGHEKVVEVLLPHGPRLDAEDHKGNTPLNYATDNGHRGVAKLLRENLEAAELIFPAALEGEVTAATKLLRASPHVINASSGHDNGSTPLHVAAEHGRSRFAAWLLEHDAKIDAVNQLGQTPLHGASKRGRAGVVRLLLSKGAQPDIKDKQDMTPLQYARQNRSREVVELLRKAGARE